MFRFGASECLCVIGYYELNKYNQYKKGTLMDFYTVLSNILYVKLTGFKAGAIKEFYDNNSYRDMAICVNIVKDTSNHITIHKAKGAEYSNVFVTGNNNTLKCKCSKTRRHFISALKMVFFH